MTSFTAKWEIEQKNALSRKIQVDIENFFAQDGHIVEIPPGFGAYSEDNYYDVIDAEEEIRRFFL